METLNKPERCKDCNTPMIEARKSGTPGAILVCRHCGSTKQIAKPPEEPSNHVPPEQWQKAPWWLEDYMRRQVAWSTESFGPGDRTEGVMKHMESEIHEVRAAGFGTPDRLVELADLWILALDAVWRNGYTATEFFRALEDKQKKNISRDWGPIQLLDTPAFHVRSADEPPKEDPCGASTGRISCTSPATSMGFPGEPPYSPGQQYEEEDQGIMPFGPVTVTCGHCRHQNTGARFSMVANCSNCSQPCGLMYVPLGVKSVTYTREGSAWQDAYGRPVQPCLSLPIPAEWADVSKPRELLDGRLFRVVAWGGNIHEIMRVPKAGETWVHWREGKNITIMSVSRDPDLSEHYLEAFKVTYAEANGDQWTRSMENFLGRAIRGAYEEPIKRFVPKDGVVRPR